MSGNSIEGGTVVDAEPAVPGATDEPGFVLCGDNPLVYQLASTLRQRYPDAPVTAVLPNGFGSYVPRLAQLDGVHIRYAERLDEDTLRDAGVARARALALLDQADVENFHTALRAVELNPQILLVVRMFNTGLGFRIRQLFADCVVLSISEIAAPSFIEHALGNTALSYLRLGERTLYLTGAQDPPLGPVVCGVSQESDGLRLRPAGEPADRQLLLTEREAALPGSRRRWMSVARYLARNPLIRLLALLLAVIGCGCLALMAMGTGAGASIYETMLDAAGAAAPETDKSSLFKVVQLFITFTGLTMTPVVTAVVVGGVLRAQRDDAGDAARYSDHIVVAGLGNVGIRIVEQLIDLRVRVVGLDYDENARGVAVARALGVPVVIGQATWENALRDAGVGRARALVLATSSDAVNLEAAMLGKTYRDDLRVVLRLSDDDLAAKVRRSRLGEDGVLVTSVFELAAAGFAAAMTDRRVIATLPFDEPGQPDADQSDESTLLVADVPVGTGSALLGRPLSAVDADEQLRVVALQVSNAAELDWNPAPETILMRGTRLIAVTTRAGMTKLMAQTEPQPIAELSDEAPVH
ncbi:NAD(P)-binding protein [Nocardia stercoris]|uniref:TrkA family potassium uptake protein n=1 Tax=Nocardia stercoris TaxID=2483361 RepID=A0A3M2KPR2_9NOCA|nr:NAD(P)-binding protein [Nocardia stercoris]RMI27652.1 hypothetical protein EBN03_33310 [Nocardia stercoris]